MAGVTDGVRNGMIDEVRARGWDGACTSYSHYSRANAENDNSYLASKDYEFQSQAAQAPTPTVEVVLTASIWLTCRH